MATGRTLLYDGLAQNDVDMANFRLLNLDMSNFPPSGIPPTINPPQNEWLHAWDAPSQSWTTTRPTFIDIGPDGGTLTGAQQQRIEQLGTVRIGHWQASVITGQFLTTLDLIRAPVGNVNLASKRLVNVADPLDPGDAVNLRFMDFLLQGLQPKEAVRCASTGNLALHDLPRGTIDGVEVEEGDRILVKNQSSGRHEENGIYILHETGRWDRSDDADTATELERAYCAVLEGDTQGGTSWVQVNHIIHDPPDFTGDDIHFILFSSTPSSNLLAGAGLTRDGNTLNVGGTTNRISVSADSVNISTAYVGQTSITTLGAITEGTWFGDTIDPARGGTGVNNGAATIDLCGNFSTIVSTEDVPFVRSLTFQLTAITNLILPASGTLATTTGAETLGNKRIIKRVGYVASNAAPSINVNSLDCYYITSLSVNVTSMTDNLTGVATDGQELAIWIKDNGTGRSIAWGTSWTASTDLPLPTATTAGAWLYLGFIYSGNGLIGVNKWVLTQKLDNIS